MKNKKGFTLVELLAIIVVISLLMVIIKPLIFGIIEEAKKASFKITAGMIAKAGEIEHSRLQLESKVDKNMLYEYIDGVFIGDKDLDYKGERPKKGLVNITEEGLVELAIHNGTYCA